MERALELIKSNSSLIITALVVIAAIIFLIRVVRNMMRKFAETMAEPIEVMRALKTHRPDIKELNDTPKSVSGMDSVYLPQIARDFPHVNIEEFKKMARNSLSEVFNSIERQSINENGLLSKELMTKTQAIIDDHKSQNIIEHFDNVKYHNLVVSRYSNIPGKVQITFQTALQYVRYVLNQSGELIDGDKDMHTQKRYNITMEYVQDVSKIESVTGDNSFGLNCPNCGAPITNLGSKFCQYCGTGIVEVNVKSWVISDYKLI